MTKKITLRILKAKGACKSQCKLFATLFPKGVEVTEALCIKHADDFNWDWGARHLLRASALAEYERATAPASAEYQRAKASAWDEYKRVDAPAWAEYEHVKASALAEYKRAKASVFAKIYLEG